MSDSEFLNKLVAFIKKVEGVKLKAYQDQGNIWTIGSGITGKDIVEGLVWTTDQADNRLEKELRDFVEFIDTKVSIDLTDNEFIAVAAFVFNIGKQGFSTSTMLKHLVKGDKEKAAGEFKKWNKSTIFYGGKWVKTVNKGLVNRRLAEETLFRKG